MGENNNNKFEKVNDEIVKDYINYYKKYPIKFINYVCETNNIKLYWWQKLYLFITFYFDKIKFKIIKY